MHPQTWFRAFQPNSRSVSAVIPEAVTEHVQLMMLVLKKFTGIHVLGEERLALV